MSEQHETNLFDICKSFAHAIGRAYHSCTQCFGNMVRLTFIYWWVVLPVMALCIAGACYYVRPANRTYKVEGTLLLNGPKKESVNQALLTIGWAMPKSESRNVTALTGIPADLAQEIRGLKTFDVIDCLGDSIPDYVDWKNKVSRLDTLTLHMNDRIAVRMYIRDINKVADIERELLTYLNSQPEFQSSYQTYITDLRRRTTFQAEQIEKLDSLTTAFYFQQGTVGQVQTNWHNLLVGDRQIELFLPEIYAAFNEKNRIDQLEQGATAPIVLESHFVVNPKAIWRYSNALCFAVLLGWILGCILAALIKYRKDINAWIHQ